jgi:hypothetical protein
MFVAFEFFVGKISWDIGFYFSIVCQNMPMHSLFYYVDFHASQSYFQPQ